MEKRLNIQTGAGTPGLYTLWVSLKVNDQLPAVMPRPLSLHH